MRSGMQSCLRKGSILRGPMTSHEQTVQDARTMRRVALAPLLFLLSCSHASPHAPAPIAAPPVAPSGTIAPPVANAQPVVITWVVDQLAAWIAAERWPLLPPEVGFARLRREGTYAKDMRYAHAATDTAPGHAALYTGAPPRGSGIYDNEVIDAKRDERVSILRDESTKLVALEGTTTSAGSSAAALTAPTVADMLRTAHSDAIIVSLSLKDRGAIMGGGAHPTATLWYDRGGAGRFVTSTAFARALPPWAAPLASPVRREPWTLLDEPWVRAHAATPDAQAGEGGLGGMGTVFPHTLAGIASPADAFPAAPFAGAALFPFGLPPPYPE